MPREPVPWTSVVVLAAVSMTAINAATCVVGTPARSEPAAVPVAAETEVPGRADAGDAETAAAPTGTGGEALVERGRFLYQVYCLDCHGPEGRGDGRIAGELDVRPLDLTLVAERAGGRFPSLDVWDVIEGRSEVEAHGQREMPVWGLAFLELGTDRDQSAEVDGRIRALVAYVKSIQRRSAEANQAERKVP